jgi:hypothetical protein
VITIGIIVALGACWLGAKLMLDRRIPRERSDRKR